jgi:hypothetical protein
MTVYTHSSRPLRELAHRVHDGIEVTLFWYPASDDLRVCVCDHRRGAYFEVEPGRDEALDVFYHPFSYASVSAVHYEDERLAA